MGAFFRFIANLIFGPPAPPPAPPPANSYYGFQYVPGVGAPGTLDPAALALIAPGAPGLYVGFMLPNLAPGFLRWAGAGPIDPVYGQAGSPFMPLAPCAAVTNLLAQLQANPPTGENWHLTAPTELDLTGYLRYATWCLNLINQTAAGASQLLSLRTGAQRVIIAPFFGGNNAVAAAPTMRNVVAQTLWGFDQNQLPLNRVAIRAAIDAQYAGLGAGLPRYHQFAADLNAMPLYSTFVNEGAFVANFLQGNYLYLGAPITGQQLMDWLSVLGDAIFEAWLLVDTVVTGVNLRRFLFLAMMITLFNNSPAGGGAGTTVGWNVLNEDMNQMGNPDWRPPAIGLAHELMHAYYNGLGTAPGYDDNNFTSTAAELQVTGIIPFNNNLVSENQIRVQWAGVNAPPPDATNTNGVAIPRRTIYTPVPVGQTPTTMRNNGRLI